MAVPLWSEMVVSTTPSLLTSSVCALMGAGPGDFHHQLQVDGGFMRLLKFAQAISVYHRSFYIY